jgi:transposase-like protein
VRHARDLLSRPHNTVSSIARLLGVSRSTIYKYVLELGRADNAAPEFDVVLAGLPEDTRVPPDVTKYDDLLPSRRPPSGGR